MLPLESTGSNTFLNGRVLSIITGALRGLGRSICLGFAKKFMESNVRNSQLDPMASLSFILISRDLSNLAEFKEELNKISSQISIIDAIEGSLEDLSTVENFEQAVSKAEVSNGQYTQAILVHNAGSLNDPNKLSFHYGSNDSYNLNRYFHLNLTSAIMMSSAFMASVKFADKKIIVNISSLCALTPFKGLSLYCTGKAARDAYFRNLALEDPKTTVLNYAPGPLKTSMADILSKEGFAQEFFQDSKNLLNPEESVDKLIRLLESNKFKSGDHVDVYDDFEVTKPKSTPAYLFSYLSYQQTNSENSKIFSKYLENVRVNGNSEVSDLNIFNEIDENIIKKINGNSNSKLKLIKLKELDKIEEIGSNIVPVVINPASDSIKSFKFNFETYFKNLNSNYLGQHVIFADVVDSTMTLIDQFTDLNGIVGIANQQTEGRGRGKNQWISPIGCAMFSVHVKVSLTSKLGQKLGFIQHLMALSLIHGILDIPGCSQLDLRIKWPNDIYYGKYIKIGGILVTSVLRGQNVHCFLGAGLNVLNSTPTTCLNDIIRKDLGEHIPIITKEEIIARTINELEKVINKFNNEGADFVKKLYLEHWIHSNQSIRLADSKNVVIEGLDDEGYLLVRDLSSDTFLSLYPDGNSLDMMQNLLVRKQ